MRILLTEDNFIVGKSIKQILENKKYLVDWVQDGESCETALRNTKLDIINFDKNLPDISGIEIIKKIPSKKIILLINILYIFPIIKAGFFSKKVARKNLIKIPLIMRLAIIIAVSLALSMSYFINDLINFFKIYEV
jgi:CheY-like chemotaxis protein